MTPTPLPLARALAAPLPRGTRASGANIPPNMRARLSAAEAIAWSHSDLAGALWESGHRAAVAVRIAEKYLSDCKNNCCADSKTVQNSPRCQSQHPTGRNPETPLENTKMKYQIYCDRGQGLSLDGCWGSENASFDELSAANEAARQLSENYPDCAWVVSNIDGTNEFTRIPENTAKTVSAVVDLVLSYDPSLPTVITLNGPRGYIKGDGGEIYFDEHDGASLCLLVPAIADFLPSGFKAESNGKNDAWISHWNDEALAELDDRKFKIRMTQKFNIDADGETDWTEDTVSLES